ncbi:MAG: TIGR03084 family metal-binding protein [Acidimicrobiales bacterium]
MSRIEELCSDLTAELHALDAAVADLTAHEWQRATPAQGWDVRDQISHLAFFDVAAALAIVAPDRFEEHKRALFAGKAGQDEDVTLGRTVPPEQLLRSWRGARHDLRRAVFAADPTSRVAWYGPDMSLASFVTARLMETWAHGQDVRDALELPACVSERLRHVCHIGVSARRYAFLVHGLDDPGTPVRVEATSPAGETWGWGPSDAPDKITGSALGVALVFTQRRHRDDTDVRAEGPVAAQWLEVAQAFAGPASGGRQAGLGMPAGAVLGHLVEPDD